MKYRAALCFIAAVHLISGASAEQNFEVASVRVSQGDGRGVFEISPGGDRLTIRNTFLGVIIMRAFHIDEPQFTMPSPPLLRDRFDIEAKVSGHASRSEMMLMLQHLLIDRFKLAIHRETKD